MSKPGNFQVSEDSKHVSYEYDLNSTLPINVEQYMGEADFKQVQEDYLGDSDLWLDQYAEMAKVEIQTLLNSLDLQQVGPNFLGFQVGRTTFRGEDLKNASLEVEVLALYEIPFSKISDVLIQGLDNLGK